MDSIIQENLNTFAKGFMNQQSKLAELEEENRKLKAELEEADKAKMNALNGMSDLSSFGLEQVKKLEEENKKMKGESEELKIWLREKLPLALLKEYMGKFEGVDLENE